MKPAVELQSVSVSYPSQRPTGLKEWAIRRARGANVSNPRTFEALRDVSLKVDMSDAVGVIGGNGSGKSTLLRVIAGILTPTSGCSVTRGTIAPLIELGTGFDQDLTGIENIYMNGAMLGRSRAEVRRSLDEIIDFSGLAEFIDLPLRTYSTGMIARLAFSIATQVEADIILLDEILAAGDQTFRERCSRRIESFYKRDATIVLVSHDLDSVSRLCKRVIWLRDGAIVEEGAASEVIEHYRIQVARGKR